MQDPAEKDDRGRSQAQAQLASIVEMVKRLQHCQDCKGGEDCELTAEEIHGGINQYHKPGSEVTEEEREEYHDEEAARTAIEEDPLSLEVRSDWHTPGDEENSKAAEYNILLCTGGPACRIIGELDRFSQPETARLQYQDWFTPWEELFTTGEDHQALVSYAQVFYFGE